MSVYCASFIKSPRDERIGHRFADLNLENHLPVIMDFREKILFGKPVYFGNPLFIHQKLNEILPRKPEHSGAGFKFSAERLINFLPSNEPRTPNSEPI